jgi:hypothetical protein
MRRLRRRLMWELYRLDINVHMGKCAYVQMNVINV